MTGRLWEIGCAAVLLLLVSAGSAPGQQSDQKLWEEIQALKRGQEEILRQLLEVRQLIQSRMGTVPGVPEVRNAPVDLGNRPAKGSAAARLTLIEFSDYQCPYCARHTRETDPQIAKEYVETGKLRYVFFDMPLESIHRQAFKAAEASRCAQEQGKYWEMHYRLFANQQTLEPWNVHAKALGLDVPRFEACMSTGKFAGAIRADMVVAQRLGINSTPSFLLATADPNVPTRVRGLSLVRGAEPFGSFKLEIDKALVVDAPGK
jgi:protein-disulfide isomerase